MEILLTYNAKLVAEHAKINSSKCLWNFLVNAYNEQFVSHHESSHTIVK